MLRVYDGITEPQEPPRFQVLNLNRCNSHRGSIIMALPPERRALA